MPNFDFLLIGLNEHNERSKLITFLEGFGSKVFYCKDNFEAFEILKNNKIANIISYNQNNASKQFIVEASVKKIMKDHTFYFASDNEISEIEKIKLMTLGFYGFIKFPFNATEVQNTLDFSGLTSKAS